MPAKHSPTGGSGIDRWQLDHCPGSVAMAQGYPNISTPEAIVGTAAHELAHMCKITGRPAVSYFGTVIDGVVVDAEMVDAIDGYLSYINALEVFASFHGCELSMQAGSTTVAGTVDHIARIADALHVTDLKYGFVPVPATTGQLKYYAALYRYTYEPALRYVLTVYQPRLFGEGTSKTIVISDPELVDWTNNILVPSVELALSGSAPRRPGKWCRYCPGKVDCPELREQFEFMQPPFKTSNESLAKYLDLLPIITAMGKDLKAEGINRALRGETIPGFKPIRKKTKGVIKDHYGLINAMAADGIPVEQLYESKLKTITELRGINKNITNQFVIRDDGRPSLVNLDDPTPAINTLFGVPQNVKI